MQPTESHLECRSLRGYVRCKQNKTQASSVLSATAAMRGSPDSLGCLNSARIRKCMLTAAAVWVLLSLIIQNAK